MSLTAQDEIKKIVNLTIKPILKDIGYRKKGNTWNLCEDELIKVVNVQLSSVNSSSEAKFTINLGIFNQRFYNESLNIGRVNVQNIKEYDCEIRKRIGEICQQNDLWWKVYSEQDNTTVLEDLKMKFIDYALPWLNSFKSLEDEYIYFNERQMHQKAFISAYILDKNTLLEHLREEIKEADTNYYYVKTIEKRMMKRNLTF